MNGLNGLMEGTERQDWTTGALAIETRGLAKAFGGEMIVKPMDLQVPEGSVFGLMGPNGAGKSTLIRMLLGILIPTGGEGTILGKSITDPSGQVRREVGYVADFQQMYPFFRLEQMLEFGKRMYPNWDDKRCKRLMDAFELPRKKWVWSLSKGMKTQMALVMALSIRPRVLILDEPTSGLDPVRRQLFQQLVMQEAATGDTTVFFSTHNLHELERMADQVALMLQGRLLLNKPLDEWKASARKIQAVFPDGFPEEIAQLPQVLKVEAQGRLYVITVSEGFENVMARVRAANPTFVEAIDVGLEELFIQTVGKEGYGNEMVSLE